MPGNRYYIKGDSQKELEEVEKVSLKPTYSINVASIKSPFSSSYTKPEATHLPQAFIVVFSGGTKREKDYFHLIDKNPNLYNEIKIEFWANPNFEKGGKPKIVEYAVNKAKEYKESANEENPDNYFLLTDVDDFGQYLAEMKQECETNDIELIVSNSCFEVWLYYAERNDKCIGFEIPDDESKISSTFKTWANNVVKGGLNPTKAILKIEQNIKNARDNYAEENGFPTLFSTQMFRLAEKMLPYVKDGNARLAASLHRNRP